MAVSRTRMFHGDSQTFLEYTNYYSKDGLNGFVVHPFAYLLFFLQNHSEILTCNIP